MKVLTRAGKVLIRAGKVVLNTAACIARCCGGSSGDYYSLNLCFPNQAPPDVPRTIRVLIPFTCSGCPLASDQLVIYRGYCYKAWQNTNGGCAPMACADGRCESPHFNEPSIAPIVNPAELQCKPVTVTCSDLPCVPEEPGCCTTPVPWTCPDGSQGVCNLPKRFRLISSGEKTVTEWCSDSPSVCTSWQIILKYRIKWNVWHEFSCEETGVGYTTAYCRQGGGQVQVEITEANDYYVAIGVMDKAGTWTVKNSGGGLPGDDSAPSACGYDPVIYHGQYSFRLSALSSIFGEPACGIGGGMGTPDVTCSNGRTTSTSSGNFSVPDYPRQVWSFTDYCDCFHNSTTYQAKTYDAPNRCASQPRWFEDLRSQKQLVYVTACPASPPQSPVPRDALTFDYFGTAGVVSTGDLL